MMYGQVQLGNVGILLNGKRDPIEEFAEEAAGRITDSPEAKARMYVFMLHYLNRAVETATKD